MATPKMTGMTPNSLGAGSFGFSPALLGQSPAAILKHRSPVPSGNFHSPGMISALGMSGMEISMNVTSNMGVVQGSQDETKKKELSEILRLLRSRPGRVSEAAVERLASSMGLPYYKDTTNGVTTLSLAPKTFLLDIDFVGYHVERVALSFGEISGPSMDFAPRAAAIFRKCLTEDTVALERKSMLPPFLIGFSENLQRLATTDRLSTPSLNCFTAITGIYESLNKIFQHERGNMGGELAALCNGNGRPQMHIREKIGLSVDYWSERRLLSKNTHNADDDNEQSKLWRVIIEVQEAPTEFEGLSTVTPIRVSNHWVSDEVKKSRGDSIYGDIDDLVTDWLEPDLEQLMDVSEDLSQARTPPARFLARLDPPVVVPVLDEIDPTHNYAESTPMNVMAALLFPDGTDKVRKIVLPGQQEEKTVMHRYQLHSSLKPVYSRQVTEIPFSHPKDLQPIFKTLRQYALIATLLEGSFSHHPSLARDETNENDIRSTDDLDNFLDSVNQVQGPLPVDISLAPEHGFGISIVFPSSTGLIHLLVQIEKNGELKVTLEQDNSAELENAIDIKAVERALRISEDIGLVIERLRN
ncbi:mediator of RNA polymerase II transcription subunit 1-domain-containing protein [Geopyxis carbonaria]|nr:mediator of RNA polymerase II transcription subunit 1-domain-containing protein [Geopyxis carbonaria]